MQMNPPPNNTECAAGRLCIGGGNTLGNHYCCKCKKAVHSVVCSTEYDDLPDNIKDSFKKEQQKGSFKDVCRLCEENAKHQPAAKVTAAAAAAAEGGAEYNPLDDKSNYMDHDKFFNWLQDPGHLMNAQDRGTYFNNKKKKSKNIKVADKFYPHLWQIGKALCTLYRSKKETVFQKLPTNDTTVVHDIGDHIFKSRMKRSLADIHSFESVVTDSLQLILAENLIDEEYACFYSQRELLKWAVDKWANTIDDIKKATTDDKLRAVGIMFLDDMREYIPYLLSVKDPSGRLQLDEWSSKKRTATRQLFLRFIDTDYVIEVPARWLSEEAKTRTDKFAGAGAYDSLNFNLNNTERMEIAWTESEVHKIFSVAVLEYNTIMKGYTKNTGGGDGNELAVVTWEDREDLDISGSTAKNGTADVHLTIVHLWDKAYEFPLTVTKGNVPDHLCVDDYVEFDTDSGYDLSTPGSKKQMSQASKANKDLLAQLAKTNSANRKSREEMGKNFLAGLKEVLGPSGEGSGSTGEDSKLDRQLKLQDAIAASNSQLKVHKKELKELKKRRRDIAANKADSPSNHQLAKKLKKIEKEAKLTASLVSAMEDTLADQVESLKKLNSSGKEGKGGESDESAVDWDDISDTDDNDDSDDSE
eukprot:scaffold3852_cov106-Skeletonema_marinoi.AAC.4